MPVHVHGYVDVHNVTVFEGSATEGKNITGFI